MTSTPEGATISSRRVVVCRPLPTASLIACVSCRSAIRFVQHDHRTRAAFPGEREIAFDAAEVVVLIERGDEKHRVDVGRDDLFAAGIAGRTSREGGATWQHSVNVGFGFAGAKLDRNPVADGGKFASGGGVVQ
jgi:hypothetical protein